MTSNLYTQNIKYNVNGDDISLELEIGIKNNTLITKEISYISSAEEKEEIEKSEYNMFMYFVKKGDTIWKIAKNFKVKMEDIIKLNNLENPDRINIGDRLYIMKQKDDERRGNKNYWEAKWKTSYIEEIVLHLKGQKK